jgi:hypothetical protein
MYTLHPVTVEDARDFLDQLGNLTSDLQAVRRGSLALEWMARGDSRGANLLSHSLASYLTGKYPSFALENLNFSRWEAVIERGIGMMLRPPSRLLVEAGMDRDQARQIPIRLDMGSGTMAGAFVPAHLIPQVEQILEDRLERQLRRLREAELDPVASMGVMLQALAHAREQGTGLIEAMDVLEGVMPVRVITGDRKQLPPDLRKRLESAAKPPRRPGLMGRLLGARQAAMQVQVDARQADLERRIRRNRAE